MCFETLRKLAIKRFSAAINNFQTACSYKQHTLIFAMALKNKRLRGQPIAAKKNCLQSY